MLIKMVRKKVNRIIFVSVVADNLYIATNLIKVTRSEVKRESIKMSVNAMGFQAIERICMSTSHQHYKLGIACRRIAQRCLRTRHNSPGGRT